MPDDNRWAPLLHGDLRHLHEQPGFQWAALLSYEERCQMRGDYAVAILEQSRTGDSTPLADVDYDWRATAAVLGDPALTARILARAPRSEVKVGHARVTCPPDMAEKVGVAIADALRIGKTRGQW